eukprot:3139200-Lingulodinium_polyedra.AAC.1
MEMEAGSIFKLAESGWGYIIKDMGNGSFSTSWAKEKLDMVACKSGDGRVYIFDPMKQVTKFRDSLETEFNDKFPIIQLRNKSGGVDLVTLQAHVHKVPMEGQFVWWDLRVFQETRLA